MCSVLIKPGVRQRERIVRLSFSRRLIFQKTRPGSMLLKFGNSVGLVWQTGILVDEKFIILTMIFISYLKCFIHYRLVTHHQILYSCHSFWIHNINFKGDGGMCSAWNKILTLKSEIESFLLAAQDQLLSTQMVRPP